jgi:hypothetical protein
MAGLDASQPLSAGFAVRAEAGFSQLKQQAQLANPSFVAAQV